MIRSQLKVVLAQREVAGKKPYNVLDLATETGVSKQALYNFANNVTTRYDAHVINALCRVLDVQVGELLVYVPEEENPRN